MELEKTISWIQQADTLDFFQSPIVIEAEWITVHRREERCFESVVHMPFLVGPRQLHCCLEQPSWGPNFRTMPSLVSPGRRHFLPKQFAEFYSDAGWLCSNREYGLVGCATASESSEKQCRLGDDLVKNTASPRTPKQWHIW